MTTLILGLSAFGHDSAAALIRDGEIVAAAQEERFTRIKGDGAFPHRAVDYCLAAAGAAAGDLDHLAFFEHPPPPLARLATTLRLLQPKTLHSLRAAVPAWPASPARLVRRLHAALGTRTPVTLVDHHLSHAASAFFPSPFAEAAVLTIDGPGVWTSTSIGVGRGNAVRLETETRFPHSVGMLYSAFTHFAGFRMNSGEYKLMGLAPYGQPVYAEAIRREIVDIADDGTIRLNRQFFDFPDGLRRTNAAFAALFGGPPRPPEAPITQRDMDIAASIQAVLNDIVLRLAARARTETGMRNLVLAGSVALNVVATGLLSRSGLFDSLWIQPAAGDAGCALGAALWVWHARLGQPRSPALPDAMGGAFLGPDIPAASAADDQALAALGAVWHSLDDDALPRRIAALVADGKVVALARGRMEWGPRALGARSILGDARRRTMQSHMNLSIKFRESFRPFAPIVLVEDAAAYFDIRQESPYMLIASPVVASRRIEPVPAERQLRGIDLLKVPRSDVPAVTHVDHSARVQTVDPIRNPFLHGVLTAFKALTGTSVMINTSFNVRGEPIVCTASDAFRCFMATDIDALVVGNRLLLRGDQTTATLDQRRRRHWLDSFEPD